MMRKKGSVIAWVVAIIVIIVIIAGAWYVNREKHAQQRQPGAADASSAPALPSTVSTIDHPIARATSTPARSSSVPLPSLADSDSDVVSALSRLSGNQTLGKMLADAHLIQRIVATVNALPHRELGNNILPLKTPAGEVVTVRVDGQLVLASDNYQRYAPYMAWVRHVDVAQLVDWYVRYYPLFQQAYRKLGYADGYFNDRLVEVIDHLLEAPEPHGPLALVETDTGYVFADRGLESLSAGQKLMLRMGPANEKLIKQKLRAIRDAVTGRQGPKNVSDSP